VLIHCRSELLVALGALRPGDPDLNPDGREAAIRGFVFDVATGKLNEVT